MESGERREKEYQEVWSWRWIEEKGMGQDMRRGSKLWRREVREEGSKRKGSFT